MKTLLTIKALVEVTTPLEIDSAFGPDEQLNIAKEKVNDIVSGMNTNFVSVKPHSADVLDSAEELVGDLKWDGR